MFNSSDTKKLLLALFYFVLNLDSETQPNNLSFRRVFSLFKWCLITKSLQCSRRQSDFPAKNHIRAWKGRVHPIAAQHSCSPSQWQAVSLGTMSQIWMCRFHFVPLWSWFIFFYNPMLFESSFTLSQDSSSIPDAKCQALIGFVTESISFSIISSSFFYTFSGN